MVAVAHAIKRQPLNPMLTAIAEGPMGGYDIKRGGATHGPLSDPRAKHAKATCRQPGRTADPKSGFGLGRSKH